MAQNHFLAGVGTALLFKGDDLIGVASTLTESTFSFSITAEEIRGGKGNALFGKYFHDSNLNVTLTDAMFNLQYMAASLGVNVEQGGISVMEEELAVVSAGGSVDLTETPIAFDGTMIGWYKLPTDTEWTIGTITGQVMEIPASAANTVYCVKYFYQNENARSITIPTQFVPAELHVVIMNDLFSGDVGTQSDSTRYGRLITDIPRLQMDGNQDLSLTSAGAATVSLTGSALAVNPVNSCEDESYYGTMTEEIFGTVWQDSVIALAIENSEISLAASDTATLIVRAVYGGQIASQRKANSNFTFTIETGATSTDTQVSEEGVITAGATPGVAYVNVALTGYANVPAAIAEVTVTA